jgi:hypothetical protein
MKKIISIMLFHAVLQAANAQTIKPKVLNNGGTSNTSSGINLAYSIGEFSIATFSKPGKGSIQSGFLHGFETSDNFQPQRDDVITKIEQQKTLLLSVYPNPANNNAVVQFTSNKTGKYTVELTDVSGKVLQTKNGSAVVGKNNITIDISKYAQGMYIINLTDDEHGKRTLKLNKQ